jgi:hypothetical protein
MKRLVCLLVAVGAVGAVGVACSAPVDAPIIAVTDGDDEVIAPPAERTLADVPVDDALFVLQVALPPLVGRNALPEEQQRLRDEGSSALASIVEEALHEPAFAQSARTLIERKLSVSGQRDGVDFGLPGNLAAHIAANELPWSQILTADACYDSDGDAIACDSGAPYTAGVLTTRGYLKSRAGRFNLTRSSTLMRAFACIGYPQPEDLEPLLPKEKLIELFRAESIEEASETDPRANGGFGNGEGCYFCHGQFGSHAQLFVKFDDQGIYRPEATGDQDPTGELGRSTNGLMTSHMADPADRVVERSQMFGQAVDNLVGAAQVFVQNPVFATCSVRNVMEHVLLVEPSIDVDFRLLTRIADEARTRADEPTLQDIVVATLSDPLVIDSVVSSLRGEP